MPKLNLNFNIFFFLCTLEQSSESNRENGKCLIDFSGNRLIAKLLFSVQDAYMVPWKHFCYCSPVSSLESNASIEILCAQEKCNETKKLYIVLPPKC